MLQNDGLPTAYCCRQLWWRLRLPHLLHNRHCPHIDGGNTPYQVNHLLLIIAEAVAVELLADGGALGLLFLY